MVSSDMKHTTLETRAKMLDREINCKQLTTKRTVPLLSWGELAAEKRERLPGAVDPLLECATDAGERSVGHQANFGCWVRMVQQRGIGESSLDAGESLFGVRRPRERRRFRSSWMSREKRVQRLQNVSAVGNEPVVEVD